MNNMGENAIKNAKIAAEEIEHGLKKRVKCMKRSDMEINIKCSEYDALMFLIGTTALIVSIHMIMCMRRKSKLKKEFEKKAEKKETK